MNSVQEEKIRYTDSPIDDAVMEAALSVASDMGYDLDSEHLIDYETLSVRELSSESALEIFKIDLADAESSCECLLRIDYETWSMAKEINPMNPEEAIYRREHVYVLRSALSDESIHSYGLGHEYNIEHYVSDEEFSGNPEKVKLKDPAMLELLNIVKSEHGEIIAEWVGDDFANIPDGLSPRMKSFYNKIIKANKAAEL